jgi:hypothetical protein
MFLDFALLNPGHPLLLVPYRKLLLDVLPCVQHAHDLRRVVDDAVEDDVRRGGKRTQLRAQLVSCASRKRMFFDQCNHFGDFAEYLFRGMAAGDPDIVMPNPLAIVERLRRP